MTLTGNDPASRHARRLLLMLGADVTLAGGDPGPSAAADWGRSGAMVLTGRADGPPLLAPGAPASAIRGALLVLRALTELRGASVADPWPGPELLGERAALAGLRRRGPFSAGGAYRPLRTTDGWAGLSLTRPSDVELLPALLETEVVGDPWEMLQLWAATRTADAVAGRAQLLGLAAARVTSSTYDDEQSRWRGGLDPVPFVFTSGGPSTVAAVPTVVDLTSLWAGPLCAHLLGLTGAHVIKVESIRRPDGARRGPRAFFDLLHAGHESVALDFTSSTDREALEALVRCADVVVDSSRPRALRQLGILADDVVAAGTTWTSITAYGRTGPWANRVGFGDDVAAAAGLVAWEDGVPMPCGDAIADPLTGVYAAVAAAATLLADRAHLIDVSMRDVAAMTLTDGEEATVPIAPARPRARRSVGSAVELGAHTAAVLDRLASRA